MQNLTFKGGLAVDARGLVHRPNLLSVFGLLGIGPTDLSQMIGAPLAVVMGWLERESVPHHARPGLASIAKEVLAAHRENIEATGPGDIDLTAEQLAGVRARLDFVERCLEGL